MPDSTIIVDNLTFALGCDSYNDPEFLGSGFYVSSMNTVCRGGVIQSRPGMVTTFNAECGWPQMFCSFQPSQGPQCLVWATNGYIYFSRSPFTEYARIEGIKFSPNAKIIRFTSCIQTTDYDESGVLYTLPAPRNLLIIQDGRTRAAYWDGYNAAHINPTQTDQTITYYENVEDEWTAFDPTDEETTLSYENLTQLPSLPDVGYPDGKRVVLIERVTTPDRDGTPIGLWMEWAGNRLWVSRGSEVYASDFGNPLKFTESQYLAEGRSFTMPEKVTGMIQPGNKEPLYIFGRSSLTILRADISDRTQWLTTVDFQRTEWGIGCIAGRSIVKHLGLVWWYSEYGWINLNSALQNFRDSRYYSFDKPMAYSKGNIANNLDMICGATFEDYQLVSVPSGDSWNRHTWCGESTSQGLVWNSHWQGIRPVEWAKARVAGVERIFCLSRDEDGVNRIWEAFKPDRLDNGQPIVSFVQTKWHTGGDINQKLFRMTEISIEEMLGTVDFAAFYTGTRGAYQKILTKRMVATKDAIPYDRAYTYDTDMYGFRPQTRKIRTQQPDDAIENTCVGCDVESVFPKRQDRSFGMLFVWAGRMGISNYRMQLQMRPELDHMEGACETDETGPRSLRENGCAAQSNMVMGIPYQTFSAVSIATDECLDGQIYTGTGTAESIISEQDATRRAEGKAELALDGVSECERTQPILDENGDAIQDEFGENLYTG